MTFSYGFGAAGDEFYPTAINYSGRFNGSTCTGTYNSVQFIPDATLRTDVDSGYIAGGKLTQKQRIKTIRTLSPMPSGVTAPWVKEYRLDYGTGYAPATGRSRLQSVEECEAVGQTCLPKTNFAWQDGGTGVAQIVTSTTGFNGGPGYDDADTRTYVDVNGDGKVDFCRFEGNTGAYYIYCTVNIGSDGSSQTIITSGLTSRGYIDRPGTAAYVDVNGDGKADFCRFEGNPGTYYIQCTTNLGVGGAQQVITTSGFNSTSNTNFAGYEFAGTRAYVDANGDGKADFCRFEGNPVLIIFSAPPILAMEAHNKLSLRPDSLVQVTRILQVTTTLVAAPMWTRTATVRQTSVASRVTLALTIFSARSILG